MKYRKTIILHFILFLWSSVSTYAHEIRPGFLRIVEVEENHFEVTWKIPKIQNRYIDISPLISGGYGLVLDNETVLSDALIRKYSFITEGPINGHEISIDNLEKTLVDVLVQVELYDQTTYSFLLQPSQPSAIVPYEWSTWKVVHSYVRLGIKHILSGYDHLLFVLGLMLIIPGMRMLIKTITSFTIAHSITLALATLGFLNVPSKPVEAVIALSIVLLAREAITYYKDGTSLTIKYPWIVAFVFGLIHGLGFAGALSEIGLPQKSIPAALLTFNIGVELGQISFILAIIGLIKIIKMSSDSVQTFFPKVLPYLIGSVAFFWFIGRVLSF